MNLEETARGLIDAMQPRGGTEPYDTSATVLRVEGGTLWVHIPGGAEETPVQKTINASPGDTIQIRVGGGTAWAVGNATAPPTDDAMANTAHQAAEVADGKAVAADAKAEEALELAKVKIGWAEIDDLFAEDITVTGSFQIDNENFSLTAANHSVNLQAKTNLGSVTVGGIYCGNGTPEIGGNAIVAAMHKTVEGTTTATGTIALNIPVNQYGILCVWRVDDTSICTPFYPTAYSGWWAKVTTSGANPAPVANTSVILEVEYYYRIAVKPM